MRFFLVALAVLDSHQMDSATFGNLDKGFLDVKNFEKYCSRISNIYLVLGSLHIGTSEFLGGTICHVLFFGFNNKAKKLVLFPFLSDQSKMLVFTTFPYKITVFR